MNYFFKSMILNAIVISIVVVPEERACEAKGNVQLGHAPAVLARDAFIRAHASLLSELLASDIFHRPIDKDVVRVHVVLLRQVFDQIRDIHLKQKEEESLKRQEQANMDAQAKVIKKRKIPSKRLRARKRPTFKAAWNQENEEIEKRIEAGIKTFEARGIPISAYSYPAGVIAYIIAHYGIGKKIDSPSLESMQKMYWPNRSIDSNVLKWAKSIYKKRVGLDKRSEVI